MKAPRRIELNGQPLPESMTKNVRFAFIRKETARLMGSKRVFKKYGQCGIEISDFLPHLADMAVFHLPGHIASGLGPVDIVIDLVRLTLLGTLFALLYLRTGNLFIGIGIHSLSNNPTALFVPDPNQDSLLALAFGALIIIFWPRRRERESETTARSSAAGSNSTAGGGDGAQWSP